LAPKYRRETNNYYKTADIGARGRVRAEERKKVTIGIGWGSSQSNVWERGESRYAKVAGWVACKKRLLLVVAKSS